MDLKNKNVLMIGGILLVVVILGVVATQMKGPATTGKDTTENVLPENEEFPTVESTVEVSMKADKRKEKIVISVANVPSDVTLIEYEATYQDKDGNQKGGVGEIEVDGTSALSDPFPLGTCSSGACVYDNGGDSVKINLKFTGSKGTRVFEKEFPL